MTQSSILQLTASIPSTSRWSNSSWPQQQQQSSSSRPYIWNPAMDQDSLQLRETWLRVDIIIARSWSEPRVDLENLETFKKFLSAQVMAAWQGLIGWYGFQYRSEIKPDYHKPFGFKETTYSMIFRFSTETVRGRTREEVDKEMCEFFGVRQPYANPTINGYGSASVDMVPRREQFPSNAMDVKAFGVLPAELSCFYWESCPCNWSWRFEDSCWVELGF